MRRKSDGDAFPIPKFLHSCRFRSTGKLQVGLSGYANGISLPVLASVSRRETGMALTMQSITLKYCTFRYYGDAARYRARQPTGQMIKINLKCASTAIQKTLCAMLNTPTLT